jgi:putative hydrolase of the HAD superfamily
MLKAIFFDFDGTLADDDGASLNEALRQACRVICNRWAALSSEELIRVYWQTSDVAWGDYDRYLRHLSTPEAMLAAVWQQTLAHWGLHDPAVEEEAARIYWQQRLQSCRPYPDVLPLLHHLISRRVSLGVLTNGAPPMQRAKLHATGLAPFFHQVLVGGEFVRGKPDPAIFLAALERAGCQPDEAVHIGDSLFHDVGGAGNVGIHTVWLNRRGAVPSATEPTPDFSITTLDQLVDCLAHLEAKG